MPRFYLTNGGLALFLKVLGKTEANKGFQCPFCPDEPYRKAFKKDDLIFHVHTEHRNSVTVPFGGGSVQ